VKSYLFVVTDPIELVIFDCDGVLVDKERIVTRVDAGVLATLGWSLSEAEIIDRFVGRSTKFKIEQIETYLGRSLSTQWRDNLDSLYREAVAAELAPVDGVVEALDQIEILACVASNGRPQTIQYSLELTGLYQRFQGHIFSASEVAQGKPAPDLFLYAAKKIGVIPPRCVVVEDSQYGVQAARAAGMRVFAYAGGLTPARLLEGANTVVFEDMRTLPGLLGCV